MTLALGVFSADHPFRVHCGWCWIGFGYSLDAWAVQNDICTSSQFQNCFFYHLFFNLHCTGMGRLRENSKDGFKSKFSLGFNARKRPNRTSDRERERVRGLSRAFSRLKTALPWVPADTKLSKLDTLKLASWYISYLVTLLGKDQEQRYNNYIGDATSHLESLVSEK